ncbi:MAG: phage minor head protein [Ghiorsea sp.]
MKPLPFVEAIAWAKVQGIVLPDEFYGERIAQARANARTISGLAGVDQIQSIFDKLDKVLASGGTFETFKKAVRAGDVGLGLPTHRLELIFRNNIQSAYMAGRWQQVERNKDNRPYLQYSAINDGRTRPSHRKMHGFIARVDDKIWNVWTPLNGHRCRCTVRSLSEKQAKALGISDKAKGKPDDGWDYNAGKTPSEGLKKAAEHKKTVVDGRLGDAVQRAANPISAPVSQSIEALAHKRIAKHVLGVIDSVHGDGVLPIIPLKSTTGSASFIAYNRASGDPVEIGISTKQKGMQHHALVHEIGHFIDRSALDRASDNGGMLKLMKAAKESKAIAWIDKDLATWESLKPVGWRQATDKESRVNTYQYLLKEHEIWARAYAQWITEKSGDPLLVKQLEGIMSDDRHIMQWTKEDFKNISHEIDVIMLDMGWII